MRFAAGDLVEGATLVRRQVKDVMRFAQQPANDSAIQDRRSGCELGRIMP